MAAEEGEEAGSAHGFRQLALSWHGKGGGQERPWSSKVPTDTTEPARTDSMPVALARVALAPGVEPGPRRGAAAAAAVAQAPSAPAALIAVVTLALCAVEADAAAAPRLGVAEERALVGDDEACRLVSDVGEVGEYVGEQAGNSRRYWGLLRWSDRGGQTNLSVPHVYTLDGYPCSRWS